MDKFKIMSSSEFLVKPLAPRWDGGVPDVKVRGEALSEPIYYLGLQWAVTAYGLEARDGTYAIAANRLWEMDHPGYSWLIHMGCKNWVDKYDFRAAFFLAQEKFKHLKPSRFSRDGKNV